MCGREAREQVAHRGGEGGDAFVEQARGDRVEVDTDGDELVKHRARRRRGARQDVGDSAVIAERRQRRGRHRVDYAGAGELLDVFDIAVAGILGAGRRPQQPLRVSARLAQGGEAVAAEQLVRARVREPGVGYRGAAGEIARPRAASRRSTAVSTRETKKLATDAM